jgi:hypothetical protein
MPLTCGHDIVGDRTFAVRDRDTARGEREAGGVAGSLRVPRPGGRGCVAPRMELREGGGVVAGSTTGVLTAAYEPVGGVR